MPSLLIFQDEASPVLVAYYIIKTDVFRLVDKGG